MTLLHAAARTMLASYFVINGVKAIKDPQAYVPDAEPVANALLPAVKRFAPVQVAARVPEDTVTLVRITGAVQAVGGLALATGIGRRFGALLLAGSLVPQTLARHPFWTRTDPEEKKTDRSAFIKNVALCGGVLIASADTEGQPSLAWRANAGRKSARKGAERAVDSAEDSVKRGGRTARRQLKHSAREARHAARAAKAEAKLAAKNVQLQLS